MTNPGVAVEETDLAVGPQSIDAYSRLSYSIWYAFAEFIDNSTQSRENYSYLVDDVLAAEGEPLTVTIDHNRIDKTITIADNSIGMLKADLVDALKIATPTKDSRGRSKYGMGLKTAACWIGKRWQIVTCEWDSGEEWTADVDVEAIVRHGAKIPLTVRQVPKESHYTKIVISGLHRTIQRRTEETIRWYLSSMYRYDLESGRLRLVYNDIPIDPMAAYDIDTDPAGNLMKQDLPETMIGGKPVRGWIAVLKKGGRKFGGFSLFQQKRQIQGFPNAWKPREIFGGVDDEGGNNLISQRLTGVIELDGFKVSHTKDAILFENDEEELLEAMMKDASDNYRRYAAARRNDKTTTWSKEKIADVLTSLKSEFTTGEMKDAIQNALLPPAETIAANNLSLVAGLTPEEKITEYDILDGLRIIVSLRTVSEYDPYVVIESAATPNTIHIVINKLHPYYDSLLSPNALEECFRQFVYDALSEYRVSKLSARLQPDTVRRMKDQLLRVEAVRADAIPVDETPAVDASNHQTPA